jgi:hypothetical protein
VAAIAVGGQHDVVSLASSLTAVAHLSPNSGSGAGGTLVTITGAHLQGATEVRFGATVANAFEVRSDSEVVATAPPGTGAVNVTVTAPDGKSRATPSDLFFYETPIVTGLSPAGGPGGGGTSVTITGTRLSGATAVHFGAAAAGGLQARSATEIVAVAPPGSGVVDVTVTTPEGTSPPAQADEFTYEAAPTAITDAASSVRLQSATLNASVDPESANVTECRFEYGETPAYGASAPCAVAPGEGSNPVPVSAAIGGLSAGATYHFRIVATNAVGTGYGADQTFATPTSELPELGRCLPLGGAPTGRYVSSNCTTTSAGEDSGPYEWHPGPGAAGAFTGKGGAATLYEVAGTVVSVLKCSASSYAGHYLGQQEAALTLVLSGCTTPLLGGLKCSTFGAAGGEVQMQLQAHVGFLAAGSSPSLGWDLRPASGSQLATVECEGTAFGLSGSIVGAFGKPDKMTTAFSLKLKDKKGRQVPESLLGAEKDTPSIFGHPAGLKATVKGSNEAPLEVKAIP